MVDFRCDSKIEVLSTADTPRRRHWSNVDKLRIVEESLVGHRQVTATVRRYGISRSLLTVWRQQYRRGDFGSLSAPAFIPLKLTSEAPVQTAQMPLPSNPEAKVEIVLNSGRQLVVPVNVDPEALARLLPILERA